MAVKRIPSHELMYSSTTQSGKNCGKLMTIYLTVSSTNNIVIVAMLLNFTLWYEFEKKGAILNS